MTKYTITEADFDNGVCTIKLLLDNGTEDVFHVDPVTFCTSVENTELQLRKAIEQIVEERLKVLFPPITPKPVALSVLVGKEFTLGSV